MKPRSPILFLLLLSAQAATGAEPSPAPSYAPTSILPDWDSAPGPVELPDLTLDQDGGISLSLEKSIELAVRGAASVLKAENDVKVSGAQLLQGYAQFLPNITAQGNYGYATGTSYLNQSGYLQVSGANWSGGYTLSSDLNLFNGMSDYAGLKSALLKKDAADLTLERARQQIALDIAQSFLQVVLDNKIVDIARKNLQQSQARERLLQEQTRVGSRNLSDLFRQQAQASADEAFLLTSQNKTRADQIAFLRKLRADVAKKYHFAEPELKEGKGPARFEDEAALLRTALERRADLKASTELSDAAVWDVKTNFASYLPKLDLVGTMVASGRTWDSLSTNGGNITPVLAPDLAYQVSNGINYAVTLNLTWTIFDRLVTHQNVEHARAQADNARIDAQDRRNQVEGEVREAYGDYKTATQQLRASKKGLEAAQKAYEVMEGRYEVGSASFIDLITVQAALVQAESARAQALIDFQLQSRNIEFAIGENRPD